ASLNLFMESPNIGAMSSMYMYAWKQACCTRAWHSLAHLPDCTQPAAGRIRWSRQWWKRASH
ncbi:hypothetical protein, partial [Stenotrophomonas maltophilia]|uniref:hypothetical protein n=1 Tax=Stenotrophomonas maltophilia TaxID=40324 RepID=UPI0039C10F01